VPSLWRVPEVLGSAAPRSLALCAGCALPRADRRGHRVRGLL